MGITRRHRDELVIWSARQTIGFFEGLSMRLALLSALIGAVLVTAASTFPASAQTLIDRAQRDELFLVPNEDPGMVAAMRKARTTLKDFLATASKPAPR
jgi:hypothetical protein